MAYQALYRKYRLTSFDEMVGQDHITKTLTNAVKENKVSHAYLFSGPRGTGKTSSAKLLGRALNCTGDEILCGKCEMCQLILSNQTSDIIEIDAASNNGVDEIREIRDNVKYAPANGKYKVYIIDETHMLTTQAFNALLKTLEEPPSHVIFILATTEPHKLPLTILSRCQRFDFHKVSSDAIVQRLTYVCKQENIAIDADALELIAYISDGGMRDALSLLDKCYSFTDSAITKKHVLEITASSSQELIEEVLLNILNNDKKGLIEVITNLSNSGYDLNLTLDGILNYLRDCLVFNSLSLKTKYDNTEVMKSIYNSFGESNLYILIDEFSYIANELKLVSNQKLYLEVSCLKICAKVKGSQPIVTENVLITPVNEVIHPIEVVEKIVEPIIEDTLKEIPQVVEEPVSEEKPVIEEIVKPVVKSKMEVTKAHHKEYSQYVRGVRINNVLALAEKPLLTMIHEKWVSISNHESDLSYGSIASMIKDGRVRAACLDGMIISFRQDIIVSRVMSDILIVEDFIEKFLGRRYKIAALTETEWIKVKDDYVRNIRRGHKYEIIDEMTFDEYFKIEKEEAIVTKMAKDMFGENFVEEE